MTSCGTSVLRKSRKPFQNVSSLVEIARKNPIAMVAFTYVFGRLFHFLSGSGMVGQIICFGPDSDVSIIIQVFQFSF